MKSGSLKPSMKKKKELNMTTQMSLNPKDSAKTALRGIFIAASACILNKKDPDI